MDNRNFIAKRAAAYFRPGDVVNLGIGIPSLCGSYAVGVCSSRAKTASSASAPRCRRG